VLRLLILRTTEIMGTDQLTSLKSLAVTKDSDLANAKPINKKFKSNFVKVTIEEINSVRPSVYKYLLP
jgi:hypothetical protein